MTDLENQWDDLPVGDVPLAAILRQGRAAVRRSPRTRAVRTLRRTAVLGGVAAAFLAGTLVVGPDGAGPVPPTPTTDGGGDLAPASFFGELAAPASCEDLLDRYRERALREVGAYGWTTDQLLQRLSSFGDFGLRNDVRGELAEQRTPLLYDRVTGTSATARGAASSDTGTNVQEAGVDEPDVVKTDGELLVRLRESVLEVYDVTGPEVVERSTLDLGQLHDGELLLAGDTVVALGDDGSTSSSVATRDAFGYPAPPDQTRVLTVSLADPDAPAVERTVDYDAGLVAARQHGDDVRLVLRKGLPDLDFETDGDRGNLVANRAAVEQSTIEDWLPTIRVDGGDEADGGEPQRLLDCDRVAIPRADLPLATTAVVGFDATAPGDVEALGLAGDAPLSYESGDHLYLAATTRDHDGTTHLYDFATRGRTARYVGAGEVEGLIRDRWSMDEADGVLRVAVGPSSETGNWNSIVTFRPAGGADGARELAELGRIDRLGVGEQIESMRWFDGLALMVTFRQIDPLYSVDLTDPADPTLLGELKIPGFSSYLHPLGPDRVLGLGTGPQPGAGGWGAQLGLFLTRDLTDPRRVDVLSFGPGTEARAGRDPRQFTWLPQRRTAVTVIARGRTGFVSAVQLREGRMSEETSQVEYGNDIDVVRLVPVGVEPRTRESAGGERVVLVTGEDVRFLDLP